MFGEKNFQVNVTEDDGNRQSLFLGAVVDTEKCCNMSKFIFAKNMI